jgi:quinol monooxygenase YgiN
MMFLTLASYEIAVTDPLTIIAYATGPPAWRAQFLEEFATLTRETLAEPGCRGFQLHEHPQSVEQFAVYETFADQAAFDAHVAAPHTKRFIAFIAESGSTLAHVAWSPLTFAGSNQEI